ncbi:N-glycosylase/DNA lyase [Anguilla anguilla]|uniref:N-glycosylase/DNA lyase n=1 Tax=Anguilla anguilla TaxID=7936 RepID=UPI0015A78C7C|nr:N-glycosylase/DNA lyase [Anguilla anguilla]
MKNDVYTVLQSQSLIMSQHAVLSVGAKLWRSLPCLRTELRLDLTLSCGQSFRWRETGEGHWTGVIGGRVWTLTQTEDTLWYYTYSMQDSAGEVNGRKRRGEVRPHGPVKRTKGMITVKEEEPTEDLEPKAMTTEYDHKEEEVLKDYFQLNVNMAELYKQWGTADSHFKSIAKAFTGVRVLRQDPTECLFSFICTSNNHISRIQGMVERLCNTLGAPLCQLDGTPYHDFPTLQALADSSVESCLRNLGFGYRARFLQQSARQIMDNHGLDWLNSLRSVPYLQARDALRSLPGVGLKVHHCPTWMPVWIIPCFSAYPSHDLVVCVRLKQSRIAFSKPGDFHKEEGVQRGARPQLSISPLPVPQLSLLPERGAPQQCRSEVERKNRLLLQWTSGALKNKNHRAPFTPPPHHPGLEKTNLRT